MTHHYHCACPLGRVFAGCWSPSVSYGDEEQWCWYTTNANPNTRQHPHCHSVVSARLGYSGFPTGCTSPRTFRLGHDNLTHLWPSLLLLDGQEHRRSEALSTSMHPPHMYQGRVEMVLNISKNSSLNLTLTMAVVGVHSRLAQAAQHLCKHLFLARSSPLRPSHLY
jgi:hypothetical protein